MRSTHAVPADRTLPLRHRLLYLLLAVPVLLLLAYFLNPFGVPTRDPRGRLLGVIPFSLPANSMAPTIPRGSLVLACTWAYAGSGPAIGDVIVFRPPGHPDTPYLKRVVGLGGDRVRFADGALFRNDVKQDEPYLMPGDEAGEAFEDRVPEGHVFVAGDHRSRSYDSRYFGAVPESDIIGRVCGRL